MDRIKMVDLHRQYGAIRDEINSAIQEVLDATAFIQGSQVVQFESELGRFLDSPFTISCANGTDALQIAFMALGLRRGDEVIVPVHTYVATAEVIALLGLVPVFVDVKEDTFNIDVDQIPSKITPRTKAIVPVHLYGQCAEMEPILELADKYGFFVIEDNAQALGSVFTFKNGNRKYAGTMGAVGTTSFFPSKNLGCFGDGGAVFTSNGEVARKLKMIANHGQQQKYYHDIVGVNSRLDTLQAAILLVKLKYLSLYEQRRNDAAAYYIKHLQHVDFLELPALSSFSTHVFHQFTIKVRYGLRDKFKAFLESHGIPTMIYYPLPLHLQKAYRRPGFAEGSFPVAEHLSASVLSLPIHTEMSNETLSFIVETIKNFRND